MNGHDITERTRLLSHERYAAMVEQRPGLLDEARRLVSSTIVENGGTAGHRLWAKLLDRPWQDIRRCMLDDSPEGRLLRSNSPFSRLIGITDPDARRKLWQQARQDLSAQRTSSELSAA